jgi:ATP:corrinoid adenosyltransferase
MGVQVDIVDFLKKFRAALEATVESDTLAVFDKIALDMVLDLCSSEPNKRSESAKKRWNKQKEAVND